MLLTSAALMTTGCSKKKDDNPGPSPSPSIEAYWVGKYISTGGGEEKISMLLKPGGVLRVYAIDANTDTTALAGIAKVTGAWTKVGNSIQTTYKVSTSIVTTDQVLNAASTQMTGTWSINGVSKGFIELNKQ